MKNNKWLSLLAGLVCLVFSACSDNDKVTPIGSFEKGVVVINEGNFGKPNGSMAFYHSLGDSVSLDVVKKQNGGTSIGATLISAYMTNQHVYLITNGPDKVEILNNEDFQFITSPIAGSDISQPRSMTVVGNKGYISCWGPWTNWDLPNSYVAVVDLSTHAVIKKIDVADGAE
jgi:hypothetical protein